MEGQLKVDFAPVAYASYVCVSISGWVEAIDETATGESSTGQLEQGATNREADDAGESDDMEDG